MSRPRKPYGPNPPGRLLGTMIKVLAAELSDQGRLSRGKRYWADDAVVDIVIGHGAVTAEVQGSRHQPYVVTIEASGGEGVPGRREVWAQCTCPDDTGTGVDLCKHAVAAFFTLADEVTIEPELIDRWRAARHFGRSATDEEDADDHDDHDDHDDRGGAEVTELPTSLSDMVVEDGEDAEIIQLRPARSRDDDDDDDNDDDDGGFVADDVISPLLRAPVGAAPPEFPEVTPFDHGMIRNRLLAGVLNDALDNLGVRWE